MEIEQLFGHQSSLSHHHFCERLQFFLYGRSDLCGDLAKRLIRDFFSRITIRFFFLLFLSWEIEQNNVPLGLASGNIEGLGEIKLNASLGDSHGVLKGCLLSYFCYCYSSSHGTRMEASSRWYHSTFL